MFLLQGGPWPVGNRGGKGTPKSGKEGRRRWGPAGEKQEETEGYLRVALARREKAGGGGSAASGRPAAALSATEAMGMTDRVKEHQWDEAKLLVGFNRAM